MLKVPQEEEAAEEDVCNCLKFSGEVESCLAVLQQEEFAADLGKEK